MIEVFVSDMHEGAVGGEEEVCRYKSARSLYDCAVLFS
jgi:hypothetical protein